MYPTLFQVGNFKVPSFGVMIVLAFFLGLWLARKRAPRYGFEPKKLEDMAIWALFAGILGARLLFIIQLWPYYSQNTHEIWSLQFSGLTSFGGLGFGALAVYLWARKHQWNVLKLLDLLAPAFLLGHIVGRFGCLLNGCCYGGPCAAGCPLGIHVHDQEGLFHPAQVYDAAMNGLALWALLHMENSGRLRPGQGFSLFLILHGIARFIYESFRAGTTSTYWGSLPITEGHAAAMAMAFVGIWLYVRYGKRGAEAIPA